MCSRFLVLFGLALGSLGLAFLTRDTNSAKSRPTEKQALAESGAESAISRGSSTSLVVESTRAVRNDVLPKGLPLRAVYAELCGQAARKDIEASRRIYHDTVQCKGYVSIQANLDSILMMSVGVDSPPSVLQSVDEKLRKLEAFIAEAEPVCSGTSEAEVDAEIFWVTEHAAKLGVRGARLCYVYGALLGDFDKQPDAVKADYKANALMLAQAEVGAGNWEMVDQMVRAYRVPESEYDTPIWLNQVITADPLMSYRYMLLERLGSSGATADRLDIGLKYLSEEYNFSDAQRAEAQAWADQTYNASFRGRPYSDEDQPDTCGAD